MKRGSRRWRGPVVYLLILACVALMSLLGSRPQLEEEVSQELKVEFSTKEQAIDEDDSIQVEEEIAQDQELVGDDGGKLVFGHPFQEKADSAIVIGWGPAAGKVIARFLGDIGRGQSVQVDWQTFKSNTLSFRLANQVLNATHRLDYELSDVPDRLRLSVQQSVDSLVESLIAKRMAAPDTLPVVILPQATFLLPFFAEAAVKKGHNLIPVFATSFGLHAAVDQEVEGALGQVGPYLVDEDAIDKLCLCRLRPWSLEASSSTPSLIRPKGWKAWDGLDWLQRLRPESRVKENLSRTRACSIKEITPMRSAMMWSVVVRTVLDTAYFSKLRYGGLILRTEDVLKGTDASVQVVESLLGIGHEAASQAVQAWQSSKSRVNKAARELPAWHTAPIADKVFIGQVGLLLDQDALRELSYPHMQVDTDFPALASSLFGDKTGQVAWKPLQAVSNKPLPGQQIDAGHCIRTKRNVPEESRSLLTLSVGHCLPSFVVLGAQKAGTDEFAVWLNMNGFSRRLDGGVEIHFFDCLGRGEGWERPPCNRLRSFQMRFNSHAPPDTSDSKKRKKNFVWRNLRDESPYISANWERYHSLGNLGYYGFLYRKSQTFEKTPAYMDLANPFDVLRLLPSVKLIFMLRDPVDRFVSSYFQMCIGMYHQFENCSYTDLEERFDRLTRNFSFEIGESDYTDYLVHRGILHSLYVIWLERWRQAFPDKNIMVVFSHHFKMFPQAVVYNVETFNGLSSSKKHHDYNAHITKSGFYVLGDYSKASKPSHKEKPSEALRNKLEAFFKPWNDKFRDALISSSVAYKPLSSIPDKLKGEHYNDFELPKWLH